MPDLSADEIRTRRAPASQDDGGAQAPQWNMRAAGKRLAFELGPALVFFLTIRFWDIYVGTIVFMAMSAVSTGWSWMRDRRLPRLPAAGIVLTLVVGGLTLALQDPQFIKMR